MKYLFKILNFLQLTDDERLSLNGIIIYVLIARLVIAQSLLWSDVALAITVYLDLNYKRYLLSKKTSAPDPLRPQVDELTHQYELLTTQVSALAIQSGLRQK